MKRGKFTFIILCLAVICLPLFSFAQTPQYHLKLLAVQENNNGYLGSDADLYLEIKEGSGRVFLETFPLTKLDTQISTRFAKEIACSHFKLPCEKYDFIFTIKAKSTIIGGPSAGAAIAALTTIALLDLPYDQQTAITGTINSGGVVGPVGGIKEKLEAASQAGLNKVLIPSGTANQSQVMYNPASQNISLTSNITFGNGTLNLIAYGKEKLQLDVLEVIDLDTVIKEITGIDLDHKALPITEDKNYVRIMQGLQEALCSRSQELLVLVEQGGFVLDSESEKTFALRNQSAFNASRDGDLYSAASFCFSNNILLKAFYYEQQQKPKVELLSLYIQLKQKTAALEEKVGNRTIETISDLQASMVVKERLNDVRLQLEKIQQNDHPVDAREMASILAYAEERFYSAVAWFQFFSMDGKSFVLDREHLGQSCQKKIMESEERFQYAAFFLGPRVDYIEEQISDARKALEQQDFILCLMTAAQAKASANAIISSLGVEESALPQILEGKRRTVERIIAENSAEGIFPILGYSYYTYATSLQEKDLFNALFYLENALELSDLSIYFPEKKMLPSFIMTRAFQLQLQGFALGILAAIVFLLFWKRGTGKKVFV
ncbi:hypothetical protein HY495_03105 [Candidatus Woesearchaeota archaeon]|nr:hypothetical protein [Candidatus Woesearchaeota archaeon]